MTDLHCKPPTLHCGGLGHICMYTLACGQHFAIILANGQLTTALDYFVALVHRPRVEPSLSCS